MKECLKALGPALAPFLSPRAEWDLSLHSPTHWGRHRLSCTPLRSPPFWVSQQRQHPAVLWVVLMTPRRSIMPQTWKKCLRFVKSHQTQCRTSKALSWLSQEWEGKGDRVEKHPKIPRNPQKWFIILEKTLVILGSVLKKISHKNLHKLLKM